jgi:hypothetical protein
MARACDLDEEYQPTPEKSSPTRVRPDIPVQCDLHEDYQPTPEKSSPTLVRPDIPVPCKLLEGMTVWWAGGLNFASSRYELNIINYLDVYN